jgi:Ca2+-binding RTX toxin-like protein
MPNFTSGADEIHLDNTAHADLGAAGGFSAGDARFAANASGTAQDASDRVVYNTASGELWYDADGNGAGARQLIATLEGAPVLAATDIVVIGEGGGSGEIVGTEGDDFIAGTDGADTMVGLGGHDTYVVNHAGDEVVEEENAGIDTVQASVSHALDAWVNNLTLTGSAAIDATGNDIDNVLTGNSAVNNLSGGLGNDTYVVSSGDVLSDTGGIDTVQSEVSWNLAAGYENLTFTGSGAVTGFGNAAANVITGNGASNGLHSGGGNDTVLGGAGDDVVRGNGGTDWLEGGAGNDDVGGGGGQDAFVFREAGTADADMVGDFASNWDSIRLDNAALTALGGDGRFASGDGRFWAADGAVSGHDANDRVVYDTSTGALYYDADGSGAGVAQLIATFTTTPTIVASDIYVI